MDILTWIWPFRQEWSCLMFLLAAPGPARERESSDCGRGRETPELKQPQIGISNLSLLTEACPWASYSFRSFQASFENKKQKKKQNNWDPHSSLSGLFRGINEKMFVKVLAKSRHNIDTTSLCSWSCSLPAELDKTRPLEFLALPSHDYLLYNASLLGPQFRLW